MSSRSCLLTRTVILFSFFIISLVYLAAPTNFSISSFWLGISTHSSFSIDFINSSSYLSNGANGSIFLVFFIDQNEMKFIIFYLNTFLYIFCLDKLFLEKILSRILHRVPHKYI